MVKKRWFVKAGYTVEAAVVCPMICIMICGMIVMTMKLYHEVDAYSGKMKGRTEAGRSVQLIRMEAVVEEFLREAGKDAGGI